MHRIVKSNWMLDPTNALLSNFSSINLVDCFCLYILQFVYHYFCQSACACPPVCLTLESVLIFSILGLYIFSLELNGNMYLINKNK